MLAQPALGRPGFRSFSLLLGHRLGGAGAAQLWSIFEQVPDWTAQLVLNLLARVALNARIHLLAATRVILAAATQAGG